MDPRQRLTVALIGLIALSVSCTCFGGMLAILWPRPSLPVAAPTPPSVLDEPPVVEPPVVERPPAPPDPERVAAGLARVGALDTWRASDAPCPIALPVPSTEVSRAPPDMFGVERAVLPPAAFPLRKSEDPERLLAAMADEVSEPSLYVLQTERTSPVLLGPRLFAPGTAAGRVFLRAPGIEGFACVGEFHATSGDRIRAGASEQPLQDLEEVLALDIELELELRRAAVESLRGAERL